jgi:hypothetical protein
MLRFLSRFLDLLILFCLCAILLTSSNLVPPDPSEKVRAFTRSLEFDYVSWTIDALLSKQQQAALAAPRYLTDAEQHTAVKQYLDLVQKIEKTQSQIETIYANPGILQKDAPLAPLNATLADLNHQRSQLGPIAEEVLQSQVGSLLQEQGLAVAGQPLPPLLYRVSPLPYALIISPRDVIREDNNISLLPDLTLGQMVALENRVESSLNVSALVEPVGGIGTYPTMVISTTDLPFLLTVISHEWTHNFLTTRPLGLNYFASDQLRTMNETTATIVGNEIGKLVEARFYPEYLPKPVPPQPTPTPGGPTPTPTPPPNPPPFDFNKEMHITRVNTDALLKDGKIAEAEAYMESRRKVFLDNGYLLRRLNQAYFAFHGAYADSAGGGAAGADPVGPAVTKLRAQSASLADFLNKISWISTFEDLKKAIGEP